MLAVLCASFLGFASGPAPLPHDPERQLAALDERIRRHPDDAAGWFERGCLRDELGDTTAALADFRTALRLAPRHAAASLAIACAEQRSGNSVAALLAARKANELGASGTAFDRVLGRILRSLHRHDESAEAFARAVAAVPRPQPSHFLELADARRAAGSSAADVLAALDDGLARLGPVVSLVDAAVEVDVHEGRFERALQRLEALRPFVRRATPLHERRACVLDAAGRTGEAVIERELARRADASEATVEAPRPAKARPEPVLERAATVPAATSSVLVPANAVWRYLDTGVWPGLGWEQPAFDDSAWASGPAQLGYGDGDEATVIASGPTGAVFTTTWFRHAFQVPDPTLFATARIRLLCDDGAAVWINGVEVARRNLENGIVLPWAWAPLAIAGADESLFRTFAFPASLLVAGQNTIAVEVHQCAPTSSDVSFALELAAGPEAVTIVRAPYLQNGTPSSAVVRWRTDQPCASQLWLGASASSLQPAFFDAVPRTDHAAVLTGLPAETSFHYRVGDANGILPGQSAEQVLRTLPPVGAVRPLRVWAIGDMGFGSASQIAVRGLFDAFAGTHPADAMLMLGDNAYYVGTDAEYQVGVFDVYQRHLASTFCWPTLGNHDAASVVTATQSGPYYDIFTLPQNGEAGGLPSGTESYYSFDRGHVHFVCLDSMDSDRSATGAMMTWLAADLAATGARWIVAFFHHPPYSAGSHRSDDPTDSGGRMTDMRAIALPILEAGGVDLVLAGHSHSYERSFLVDGHYGTGASLQPAMVRDRGDGRTTGDGAYGKATAGPAPHEGAVYVVAGSAGATSGGTLDHPAMYVGLNRLGSFVFDVDGDRLDAAFVGFAGLEDRFTLVKGEPRTLFRDQPRVSVGSGGRQDWRLAAGPAQAGNVYGVLGSFSSEPGFLLDGVHVPLGLDSWMELSVGLANSPVYPNSFGFLDTSGAATSAFVLPPLNDPSLVGLEVWHAFLVLGGQGFTMASNAVKVTLLP